MKRLAWLIAVVLLVQVSSLSSVRAATEVPAQVKELNFVFLHGAGGHACSFQLLADSIMEQLPAYVLIYQQDNPGAKIQVNMLQRCYPAYVDIDAWAKNITDSIDKRFPDKKNLILIGHSMGGKTALYAVARNVGNLANKVAMVVTINSPIKSLYKYQLAGGGSVLDYCRTGWYRLDQGVCTSLANYDSSPDGYWVGRNRHWLAFIASEAAPLSEQFDFSGVDGWPRDMDDSLVPISAQYSDGADVIYYGEHGHSDFAASNEVADFMACKILGYLFGGRIECSILAMSGTFEHKANWLPGTNYWEDTVGEVLASSGRLQHTNESYIKWQEWEDVVGNYPADGQQSSYQVSRVSSFPFLTSIKESRWLSVDNPEDGRLYLRTRAAPRNTVQVDWEVYLQGLLPAGTTRDHYEIEIVDATPFAYVIGASWITDDPRDLRLQIRSQVEGPFRWFKAEWKVYSKESRKRKVIDEIPAEPLS